MKNKINYYSPDFKSITSSSVTSDEKLHSCKSAQSLIVCGRKPERIEKRMGKYTLILDKLIGRGYSSKVYLGHQTENKKNKCAIKVINLQNQRPSDLQLLNNQISILKELDHPNVIKTYEVFKNKNFCYIVTEYCEEDDLNTTLIMKGKLNEKQALVILHDIIQGYKYLIKHNIVHRDLKPANIFKAKLNWKIGDFGFAVRNHSQSQFKAAFNVGTPLYMPPESLVRNIYSAKSDIFSIGIIFYQILIGTTPWRASNQKQLLRKMLNNPFQVPQQCLLSQEVKNILHKLCCVDIKKRMNKDLFLKFTAYNIYNEQILHNGEITINQENPEKLLTFSLNSPNCRLNNFIDRKIIPINSPKLQSSSTSNQKSDQIYTNSYKQMLFNHKVNNSPNISQQDFTYNNKIIVNQLQFCRFIYYLIKNSHVFCLAGKDKLEITRILFTHLLKLIRIVTQNVDNYLGLRSWKQFVSSKRYGSTKDTLLQYFNRYNLEHQMFLGSLQLEEVRVQAKHSIIEQTKQFTIQEYHLLKNMVTEWIRLYRLQLEKDLREEFSVREVRAKIEGIRSLVAYRKLLQISMSHYKNFQYFEKFSDIKVYTNYQSVTSATKASYALWIKQLNFL